MTTRERFNEQVFQQYNKEKEKWLQLSKDGIYECAYTIAKLQAIKDYLVGTIDDEVEPLYSEGKRAIALMVAEELHYDTPMWTTWDDLATIIENYISTKEN